MIQQQAGWKKKAINIRSMRALARKALPQPVFDFADGATKVLLHRAIKQLEEIVATQSGGR